MREYTRPAVLIIDDFAMREHTTTGSEDLYDLVSDRAIAGKPLIFTSNRAPKDWYPLFPNPVVAESLLDRLINLSHQIRHRRTFLPTPQTTRTPRQQNHLTPPDPLSYAEPSTLEHGESPDGNP